MADLGDTLPFRADVYDKPAEEGGVLTNATSAVLSVTLPDGTTATPTVANPTAGKYTSDYATTAASPQGRYVGSWLFTFSGGATAAYVETFDVGSGVVTVDEAVAHLAAAGIITREADLEQLQWLCLAASDAVERDLRQVIVNRAVTVYRDGGYPLVSLTPPVLSITTVLEDGVAVTDYAVNKDAGLLYRSSDWSRWACGIQNVAVTYQAGFLNPPRVVRTVALNLIQAGWRSSQQAAHPALTEFNEQDTFTAVSTLPQIEQRAYESLRMPA
jgi:hypothetical protein